MKQQRLAGKQDHLMVHVSKKVGFKIRHLAGQRNTSISKLMSDITQDYLKREGFLKESEDDG